jgi:2-keto-4-pentenoate hydratase/2-oxohepta-3-ene-1,7-dioic acid hydratase in catechol pathway
MPTPQVHDPAAIVAFASRFMTLKPGDLIFTGTPAGVGFFRKPPVFLQPGDEVSCQIQGIGELTNRIVAVP